MSARQRVGGRRRWWGGLAALPGSGLALLPKAACPACLPAYSGLLGAVGLGFLLEADYLLPFTASLFAVALAALAYRARTRRGHAPLALGALGAGTALLGKFALSWDALLYVGLALLMGASLWNTWPRKAASSGTCGKCAAPAPVNE